MDLDAYTGLEGVEILPEGRAPGMRLQRRSFLPFDPREISRPSAYLSTHEHEDHCDKGSVQAVMGKGGTFIGPSSSCDLARSWGFPEERVRQVDGTKFERTNFGEVEITAAPGLDLNARSSIIFLLTFDDICIMHNGDAIYNGPNYLEIASRFSIDVAIINLGKNPRGRHWYHTPYDVARAANDLRPRDAIPHHYDKWDKALEDPEKIRTALESSYPELNGKVKLIVPKLGGRVNVEATQR